MSALTHQEILRHRYNGSREHICSELEEMAKQTLNWESASQDIPVWVEKNRNILGDAWSYESTGPKIEYGDYDIVHNRLPRPYLVEFVRDQTPEKSIIKCRQSEFTETHINECLFYCNTRPHTKVAHIFPTDELGDAISAEKIGPAIDESPEIYKNLKGPTTAIRRYPFKNGSMYTITGALKKAGGRAASRDILVFDEVDSMPESIFGVYEELLSHSSLKLIRKLSTPTVPDVGIDKIIKTGCEYEWVITCPRCKKEQIFTFPDNIINYFDLGRFEMDDPNYQKRAMKTYVGCKYCKEYIDRGSDHYLQTSKWIPKKENLINIHASYHVNVMMIPWKTGREITRRMHELVDYEWQGYNEVLGYAFIKTDQKLSESEIRACERPWSMITSRVAAMSNVSIGVDYGKNSSWLVIMANGIEAANPHRKCVVYIEEINERTLKMNGFSGATTDHVKRVCQLVDLYSADILCTDANGLGVDRNDFLIKKYDKRAWGAFFDTAEEGKQIRKSKMNVPQWTENQHKVTFSKVNTWKAIQGEIRRQAIYFPNYKSDPNIMQMFVNHVAALGIQPRWSHEYEREFEVVVKMGAADHLADALMYASIGFNKLTGNRFGNTPGVAVKQNYRQRSPIQTLGV